MCCMGCGRIVCVCHSPFVPLLDCNAANVTIPPNVVSVEFRSDEKRIVDLEARIEVLEQRHTCLDVYTRSDNKRIAELEARAAAIEVRHIKLLDYLIEYFT